MLSNRQKDGKEGPEALFPLFSAVNLDHFRRADGIEETIAEGIKLLAVKLLDLHELCQTKDLDVD